MEIRNFKSEKYYVVYSAEKTGGEVIELTGKAHFDKDKLADCESLAALYNSTGATVSFVESKKDSIHPGKLYSLSTLQNVLGKKYKMSMAESLKIIQKLYEEGYLTYPRTNSEYLATAEKDKMRKILANVSKLGYPVRFKDSKAIFDDSKIESHSALTPTYKIPDAEKLSEKEKQVYSTVMRRFVAVFCAEECLAEKSEIRIKIGELEEFTLKGTVILSPGWTKYDDYSGKDRVLPQLSVGDTVNIKFVPQEKKTTAPKHYTIETLNKYLKNPFKDDKAKAKELEESGDIDDADEYRAVFEGLELGTEATRTGIIDNAKKSGYIDLKKDVYTILPDGEYLVRSLEELKIAMDKYKTSELGRALKRVYRGEITVKDSVSICQNEIAEIFRVGGADPLPKYHGVDTGEYGEILGVCPLCGKNVVRGKMSYGCMGFSAGCEFKVGITVCKKTIPKTEIMRLLSEGSTSHMRGFISKNGKSFDGRLVLKDGQAVFDFSRR